MFQPSSSLAMRVAAVLAAGLPAVALAHSGADAGTHHGLAAGLAHPFTGPDHLAAMLALGLWSGLAAARQEDLLRAPLAFLALLFTGAALAAGGLPVPAVEPMIAASLLVLGLLLAWRHRLPGAAAMALAGGFALFHGAAHGSELGAGWGLAGMLLGSALLLGSSLALGQLLRRQGPWWARAAGGATVALGAALGAAQMLA